MMTDNPHPRPPLPKRNARIAPAALAIAPLSFGAGGIVFSQNVRTTDGTVPRQTFPLAELTQEGLRTVAAVTGRQQATPPRLLEQGSPFSFADLVEHVSPAVVTVVVERESAGPQVAGLDDRPPPFPEFFPPFGSSPGQGRRKGQGPRHGGRPPPPRAPP